MSKILKYILNIAIILWSFSCIYIMYNERSHGKIFNGIYGNLPGDFSLAIGWLIIELSLIITALNFSAKKKNKLMLIVGLLLLFVLIYHLIVYSHAGSVLAWLINWETALVGLAIIMCLYLWIKRIANKRNADK